MEGRLKCGLVFTQQPDSDGAVDGERVAEDGGTGLAGQGFEQAVAKERGVVGKLGESFQPGWARRGKQVEDEVDGGEFFGYVVLQVAVNAFIAEVEMGGEADEEGVQVERLQVEGFDKTSEAGWGALGACSVRKGAGLGGGFFEGRGKGVGGVPIREMAPVGGDGALHEGVGFLIGDIEAAEGVGGVLPGFLPALDLALEEKVEAREFGQQVLAAEFKLVGVCQFRSRFGRFQIGDLHVALAERVCATRGLVFLPRCLLVRGQIEKRGLNL